MDPKWGSHDYLLKDMEQTLYDVLAQSSHGTGLLDTLIGDVVFRERNCSEEEGEVDCIIVEEVVVGIFEEVAAVGCFGEVRKVEIGHSVVVAVEDQQIESWHCLG